MSEMTVAIAVMTINSTKKIIGKKIGSIINLFIRKPPQGGFPYSWLPFLAIKLEKFQWCVFEWHKNTKGDVIDLSITSPFMNTIYHPSI
jgi:hypothetical protein